MPQPTSKSSVRTQFFELLFQENTGWFCLATSHPEVPKSTFKQHFFRWPDDIFKMEEFILRHEMKYNVYFCPHLLKKPERKKENCLTTDLLWADLDEVDPDRHPILREQFPPPIVIQSSPGRYQAIWRLEDKVQPYLAEAYSKRLAYAVDADTSGWDLTQLFRVPFTQNFKYDAAPPIVLERAMEVKAPLDIFDELPSEREVDEVVKPFPDELPEDSTVLYKYQQTLRNTPFANLYSTEPSEHDDWSKTLWRLIHICLEVGMDESEIFVVVWGAKCNKYERDGRPKEHLWRDISKAKDAQAKLGLHLINFVPLEIPQVVGEPATDTFVDTYRDWAAEATDAVVEFHDLCCFILLSAVVSNSVRLETSYGLLRPNLWGLILGDSTLTRKTTAMRMVMDILANIEPEMIVATEGSIEGLLSGLSMRPNKTSIFHRDEVSGFMESIKKKDYLAGMTETLTALYDVPPYLTRRLRKEVITIESPSFIFFGGGVQDRVYNSIWEADIQSGFIPRFLIVAGEANIKTIRPTVAASPQVTAKRNAIQAKVADLYEHYASEVTVKLSGQKVLMPPRISAILTEDAWDQYAKIEFDFLKTANDSSIKDLALPTFERLSRSILKMSTILAAARQEPKDNVISVTTDDVTNAAWYGQKWGRYAVHLISNAGKTVSEKLLEKINRVITEHPEGVMRSAILQHYHLTKREADEVLLTLEDRQLIRKTKVGKGTCYFTA